MPQYNTQSEIDQIIHRLGLIDDWHKAIDAELEQCTMQSDDILAEDDRTDLRHLPFVTVDGADAKDFDDAIYCHHCDEGIVLWVAIADVASYVRVGSALEQAASERGNSTYFPQRVLPMLPSLLSNHLCSLVAGEDRPVIACRMVFDQHAKLLEYRFSKALIHSRHRLTYQQVQTFFDRGTLKVRNEEEVAALFRSAMKLYRALRRARQRRGALDLDIPQKQLYFDQHQRIKKVVAQTRGEAHCMIEEFMICANIAAARYLSAHKLCFLSRLHEGLKKETLPMLSNFLRGLGFHLSANKAINLAHIIKQAAANENKQIIHTIILSSLQRAVYAPLAQGHFGLALKHYTHFTSPIRRYPDLLVHRAIHATLDSTAGHLYNADELKLYGQHCSITERRSDEAVWDIEQYFVCILAQAKVGQVYSGVITGVTAFGLFIELSELQASGLLHVASLGREYYRFNDKQPSLTGSRSARTYKIGQKIKVKIQSAHPTKRKISLLPG